MLLDGLWLQDTRALSSLLDSAMLGVCMQHREANGSVLGFIARAVDPATRAKCPADGPAGAVVQAQVSPRGAMLTR